MSSSSSFFENSSSFSSSSPSSSTSSSSLAVGNVVACVILGLSFLIGAPGNLLVIWTIVRHVQQRSHTVLIILHLALADLLVLITLPLWIYSLADSWVFGEGFCKAITFLINACMYGSVFLITLMSVERFLAVRYPFFAANWKRKRALSKLLSLLWTLSFLLSMPVLLTVVVDTEEDTGKEQCLYRSYSSTSQELICVLIETLVGYVLPFSILVICYGCLCSRITQMTFKSKRKSTVLIASVVVVFAVCWTPHQIGNVLSIVALAGVDSADELENLRSTMAFIAGALVFISSCVNPILYMFAARTFRSSLMETGTGIQKLFRHISSTSPGEGNTEPSFVSKRQTQTTNQTTSSSDCCTEAREQMDIMVNMCEENRL